MWDLPGPGLEPVSPALAGTFLTLRHQGSPDLHFRWSTPTHVALEAERRVDIDKARVS